jgi:hypothetical protein
VKRNNKGKYIILCIFGAALLACGITMAVLITNATGIMVTLPYIILGIGAGVFGTGVGELCKMHVLNKKRKIAKQLEIEEKDERNKIISNMAKAKAYDLMLYVYAAMLLVFVLVQAPLYVILSMVGMYLFLVVIFICYVAKFNKQM